jgi:hypothetical protein
MSTRPSDFIPALISIARFLHGDICPCYDPETKQPKPWEDCITIFNGKIQLWFNSCKTKSTHIVTITDQRVA